MWLDERLMVSRSSGMISILCTARMQPLPFNCLHGFNALCRSRREMSAYEFTAT